MKISPGAVVELRYRMLDDDGNEVEKSDDAGPIRYRHGRSEILPGLESRLEGAQAGDELRVELEPSDAFGEYDPEGIVAVPREELPADHEYQVGDWLSVEVVPTEESGEEEEEVAGELEMRVLEVHPEQVLLDANHPLAGRRVIFELVIVSVEPALS